MGSRLITEQTNKKSKSQFVEYVFSLLSIKIALILNKITNMKYLLALLLAITLLACGGEQSQDAQTTVEDSTETTDASDNTIHPTDISSSSLEEKMKEFSDVKSKLMGLENIPENAKADIAAALNLMDAMERQVANWEEKMKEYEAHPTLADPTDSTYIRALDQGRFLQKQIEQSIRMANGQLARVK